MSRIERRKNRILWRKWHKGVFNNDGSRKQEPGKKLAKPFNPLTEDKD